jgi:hypothetical protein
LNDYSATGLAETTDNTDVRMTASRSVLTAVLVSSLFTPRAAQAQSSTASGTPGARVDPREDARMRLGPFYMTPTFQVANAGVDGNVFNAPDTPQSDYTVAATPAATIWVPMARRALVTTTAGAGLVYFQKFRSERSVDPEGTVRGDLYLRRLTLYAEGGWLRSRQRPNQEIDARSRRKSSSASAGAIVQLGAHFSAEVGAYRTRLQYDQDQFFLGNSLRTALDERQDGLSLVLRQQLTPFTAITLSAESRRDRFDFSPDRNADGFRVAPGLEFNPRALISGRAEVGVRQFRTRDSSLPDFTGLVADVSLGYVMRQPAVIGFGLGWSRDVNYSYLPTQPYYVSNTWSGSIRRQVWRRVDAIVSAERSTWDYASLAGAAGAGPRTDVTTGYSADIGYRARRDIRIGFAVAESRRRSAADATRAYRGLRAGLTFSYGAGQ